MKFAMVFMRMRMRQVLMRMMVTGKNGLAMVIYHEQCSRTGDNEFGNGSWCHFDLTENDLMIEKRY